MYQCNRLVIPMSKSVFTFALQTIGFCPLVQAKLHTIFEGQYHFTKEQNYVIYFSKSSSLWTQLSLRLISTHTGGLSSRLIDIRRKNLSASFLIGQGKCEVKVIADTGCSTFRTVHPGFDFNHNQRHSLMFINVGAQISPVGHGIKYLKRYGSIVPE